MCSAGVIVNFPRRFFVRILWTYQVLVPLRVLTVHIINTWFDKILAYIRLKLLWLIPYAVQIFRVFKALKLILSKSYLTFNLSFEAWALAVICAFVCVRMLSSKEIIKTILINQANVGFENNAVEHGICWCLWYIASSWSASQLLSNSFIYAFIYSLYRLKFDTNIIIFQVCVPSRVKRQIDT